MKKSMMVDKNNSGTFTFHIVPCSRQNADLNVLRMHTMLSGKLHFAERDPRSKTKINILWLRQMKLQANLIIIGSQNWKTRYNYFIGVWNLGSRRDNYRHLSKFLYRYIKKKSLVEADSN